MRIVGGRAARSIKRDFRVVGGFGGLVRLKTLVVVPSSLDSGSSLLPTGRSVLSFAVLTVEVWCRGIVPSTEAMPIDFGNFKDVVPLPWTINGLYTEFTRLFVGNFLPRLHVALRQCLSQGLRGRKECLKIVIIGDTSVL